MKSFSFGKFCLYFHVILVYLFLYMPIAVVIAFSFNQDKISTSWSGFTLKWYQELYHNKDLLNAVKNSLVVGICSTIVATILGTLVAFGLERYSFPGKKLFEAVLTLPMIIPDIVMAVAMLAFYTFINISLGMVSIVIAHISFNITFVAVVVRARLVGFNYNLEKAAMDLGATPLKTFWYVSLPLSIPGIIAGALLAFTLSWDDYMIAAMTHGIGSTTLPITVFAMIRHGVSPEINAISTLMLFFTLTLAFISTRFQKHT
ncbi:MAG: ABC transporter permease [Planctomycetota bacterium]